MSEKINEMVSTTTTEQKKPTVLEKRKVKTMREKALDRLADFIAERVANDDKATKIIQEMEKLAKERTDNTDEEDENKKAWAHTVPSIKNHLLVVYEKDLVGSQDRSTRAIAKRNKKKAEK